MPGIKFVAVSHNVSCIYDVFTVAIAKVKTWRSPERPSGAEHICAVIRWLKIFFVLTHYNRLSSILINLIFSYLINERGIRGEFHLSYSLFLHYSYCVYFNQPIWIEKACNKQDCYCWEVFSVIPFFLKSLKPILWILSL